MRHAALAVVLFAATSACGLLVTTPTERADKNAVSFAELKRSVMPDVKTGNATAGAKKPKVDPSKVLADADLDKMCADWSRAEQILANVVATGPLTPARLPDGIDPAQRLARAFGLLRLGKHDDCLNLLGGILGQDEHYFPALMVRAQIQAREHRLAAAERDCREVIALAPSFDLARQQLAGVLLATRDPKKVDEGIRTLEKVIQTAKNPSSAALSLAEWYFHNEAYEAVAGVLRPLLESGRGDVDVALALSKALSFEGKFADAVAIVTPVSNQPGVGQAQALYERLKLERTLGKFDDALLSYRELERKFPEFVSRGIGETGWKQLGSQLLIEREKGQRQYYTFEEALILVRNGDTVDLRQRMLTELETALRVSGQRMSKSDLTLIGRRLAGVLAKDSEPSLRLTALMTLLKHFPGDMSPLSLALQDPDQRVRQRSIELAMAIPTRVVGPVLLTALEREKDPAVFRQLHEALMAKTRCGEPIPPGDENDAAKRAAVVKAWPKWLQNNKKDE